VADVGTPPEPSKATRRSVLELLAPALKAKLSEVERPGARSVEEAMTVGVEEPEDKSAVTERILPSES
jgi:hypothetical protein